jgi:murein L,D-transpeptidase YafK
MELANHYTGDAIMIHGHCASIGCYAMTDPEIDEIYTLIYKAFIGGQKAINLHILPFKMDTAHMQAASGAGCIAFWKNLKQGYDIFEQKHIPPSVGVKGKIYAFAP